MQITRGERMSEAVGDFEGIAHRLSSELEGRKIWRSPKRLLFETTEYNFKTLRSYFPVSSAAVGASPEQVPHTGDAVHYNFRMPPRDYQLRAFEKLKQLHAVALFSHPGTGKTKTAIDIMCWRYLRGDLTGVLILSSPKGVHAQWIDEQLPLHMWDNVPYIAAYWNGRRRPEWMKWTSPGKLQIFSGNIDMLRSQNAYEMLREFCLLHTGKIMIIVDESSSIKTWSAQRSRRLRLLADQNSCRQRMILTGTPIAKDLTDEWSQFYFLDPSIIGHKYKTSFMAQYCKMGGFENRIVVGHRNLDQFKQITEPYIFRAHKDELHLPDKVYDTAEFELSDEQKRLIRDIKETTLAKLEDASGTIQVSAAHAAAAVLRIQQISNGFVSSEGVETALETNPRIEALEELLSHLDGKVIVWCRFHFDIKAVMATLENEAVAIYGAIHDNERFMAKADFINKPHIRYLVATPDTAGQGLDGLQTVCENAIYYSNSYNAIARWQSEDRIHRLGMRGAASYYDLVARGSPDRAVLRNLRAKKTLSTLVLDDLKDLIRDIQT